MPQPMRPYRPRTNTEMWAVHAQSLGRLLAIAQETQNWPLIHALRAVRDERRAEYRARRKRR